ncbi:MAG: mycofactocin-coupled SDR family oxidoreductase [Acidimicrobiales bacterium]
MTDELMNSASERAFTGRVAVITGGGRGQGRSHALEFARLGADVAVCDLCRDLDTVGYPMATADDLAETVRLVEEQGRTCVSTKTDVRDLDAMVTFVDDARDRLGSVDILVANAGVSTMGSICAMDAPQWSETIDINLTGVFNAMRAAAPHMRRQRWGRIIGISSMMGRTSNPGIPAYVASKWGVIGLCKSVALELAAFGVTVNAVAPGNVSTPMIHNEVLYGLMRPDLEQPNREDVVEGMASLHAQPVPWLEPEEITAAVVFLASEAARHITGSVVDVDAGASGRFTG